MEQFTVSHHLIGGSFALSAAALWAGASILWKKLGRDVSPLGMNLGKGLVSLTFLLALFLFLGFPQMTLRAWMILGLSGVIGIALGDTAYFHALMRLGPRRILVLTTLTPVLASAMAVVLLGERPTLQWAVGAALCLGGVAWVMYERLPEDTDEKARTAGIWLGILAAFCEATGSLLTKVGLEGTGQHGWRDATFIRLLFGVFGLFVYGLFTKSLGTWLAPFKRLNLFVVLVVASFMGTFLAILFATASLWYTYVSLATILKSTSPIFILPLAWIFLRERFSVKAALGAVVAVAGVAILLTAF